MPSTDGLTILQIITPHRFAGAERQVALMSEGLIKRGHRIHIVMPDRVPLFDQFLAERGVPRAHSAIAGRLNPFATTRLCRLARGLGAQVVHTHLSTGSQRGLAAARRLGLPSIGHVHGMNTIRWYRGADVVLAGSHGIADHLRAQGAQPEKIRVIYYAVDPQEFEALRPAQQVLQELQLSGGRPTIGIAASLIPRKGHRYLLEAIAHLKPRIPELLCLVVGQGPLRSVLEAQVRNLGIESMIRFLGWVPSALEVMQLMNVFVLPSITIEGFGVCMVEAAYLRVPTVASNLPGMREAVADGETGILVPPRDPQALAEAIAILLEDDTLRHRMGEAGRERTGRLFTVDRMAAEVEALYLELLSSHPHTGARPLA